MVELSLDVGRPSELHVEGSLHLLEQLLMSVESFEDRFNDGFYERLENWRNRLDGYRWRLRWTLARHAIA
jgi:hypothetical protein